MRHTAVLAFVGCFLGLSACSSDPVDSSAAAASSDKPNHDHSSQDHGAGQHGGHASSAVLEAGLLSTGDLPAGYISGAHHEAPEGDRPTSNAPGCAPLTAALHAHHDGHGSDHPRVQATFSKSHFGPQISQTVVDYGTVDAATAALSDMASVLDACQRYEHSTSPIGANRYRVDEGPRAAVPVEGVSVRLVALGDDFDGIHWDVWTTRVDSRVLTVALRTAPGGDSADLVPAVREALEHQRA